MENSLQFVSNFFTSVWLCQGTKLLKNTAHCPKTNSHLERYKAIRTCFCKHVYEHEDDWHTFLQPPVYTYSFQVQCLANTPLNLTLTSKPSSPTINFASEIPNNANKTIPARLLRYRLLDRRKTMKIETKASAKIAQNRSGGNFINLIELNPKKKENLVLVDVLTGCSTKGAEVAQET